MKKYLVLLFSLILVAGCTIASPLTTTKDWLEAMKNNDFEKAKSFIANEDKEKFYGEYKKESERLVEYEIQNAIPLSEEELNKLNVTEGNTVYFKVRFERGEIKHKQAYVIKINGEWKMFLK